MTIPAENNDVLRPDTQVTITGRNVEVPDHFAERVHAKLAKIARLDPTLTFNMSLTRVAPTRATRFRSQLQVKVTLPVLKLRKTVSMQRWKQPSHAWNAHCAK